MIRTPDNPRVSAAISPGASATAGYSRWLLPAIAIGTTLAPLNSTMIAVALPEIQHSFNVSVTATAWLVTLYLVAMAVGQPIGGRLGDLYGRRPVYLGGLVWFAIASAGCAFAPSLPILIVFRSQQAMAGALTFPNGAAMVREAVPAERRGAAFGTVGMATSLAAASGPPIGGLLVHGFGWAAIFWANVPVVLIALLLGWKSLPKRTAAREEKPRFDIAGSGLFALSLSAVIVIPTVLKLHLPIFALALGMAGTGLGYLFIKWELRQNAPVVDVRLFTQSHFAAACASIGLSNLVMYTTLLALPLYLERVRGHDVRVSGIMLAALSVFSAIWGPIGGHWSDRSGRWLPAVTGGVGILAGAVALTLAVRGTSLPPIAVALGMMGLGIGLCGAAVQTAAVESVSGRKTGSAAGLFSTSRYLGSVLGSSVLAMVFVQKPGAGETERFLLLFAGLSIAAAVGLFVNTRIARRR